MLKDHQGVRRKKRKESNHKSGTSVERRNNSLGCGRYHTIERYQNAEEKKRKEEEIQEGKRKSKKTGKKLNK